MTNDESNPKSEYSNDETDLTRRRGDAEKEQLTPLRVSAFPRELSNFEFRIFHAVLLIAATIAAILWLDQPIAAWALQTEPLAKIRGDIARELAMLQQWGQFVCSVLVITTVALLDRDGRRRALTIAIACLITLLLTHLLKDLCGRSRPEVLFKQNAALAGQWIWGGPAKGFTKGSAWGSFPSAHTTGAFALSITLAWFYPRARYLFMTLATITAAQRILHHAHFVSDVLAGIALAALTTRYTLQAKLADRLLALFPPKGGCG